jgi:hypothetical protein
VEALSARSRYGKEEISSPDGAKRNPGTMVRLDRSSRISLRSIRATKKEEKIKEAERRETRIQRTASSDAARAERSALASRRSTTALAAATERRRSAPAPHFLGPGVIRCYLHLRLSQSSERLFARRPVIVPAGRFRRSRPGVE